MYTVLQKDECNIRIENRSSLECAALMLSGFTEVFFGTKLKCEKYKESIECDLIPG
jgi:hypothetical protein